MKYLVITNRGTLNRRLLELIGLSTKRDQKKNNSVIGNKGSGSKLASVAALRLGISSGVTSTDERGIYFLEFDTEEIAVDGVTARHVHYRYYEPQKGKKNLLTRFPSSMVLEAFPDWDKPIGDDDKSSFKILREHICNAYDADKEFTCTWSDNRHFALEGKTSVYLTNTPQFAEILKAPERYFKFLSQHEPYEEVGDIGTVWPKSEAGKTRLFLQGVLVDCTDDKQRVSLFDYSLNDKDLLSEERILKSSGNYVYGLGKLLMGLQNEVIRFAVMEAAAQKSCRLEEVALGYAGGWNLNEAVRANWLKAVHHVFGERICLPSQNESVNSDVFQIYGHVVLRDLSTELKKFFTAIGVPKADDIFPKDPEERLELVRYADLSEASRARFETAFAVFAKHFPQRARFPLYFYHPLDEAMARMEGFSGYDQTIFKEIWLKTRSRTELPTFTSLLVTLIHEGRHCETRLHDDHRGFVEAAEKDLLNEILRQLADDTVGIDPALEPVAAERLLPVIGNPFSKKARVVVGKSVSDEDLSSLEELSPDDVEPFELEPVVEVAEASNDGGSEDDEKSKEDYAMSILNKIRSDLGIGEDD